MTGTASLDFVLDPSLEATEPPETRGLRRDEVRLLTSWRGTGRVRESPFRSLPDLLAPGDLLVVNTSGTMAAAIPALRADGRPLELHLSTRVPGATAVPGAEPWVVELRTGPAGRPLREAVPGEILRLPAGASAEIAAAWPPGSSADPAGGSRLWLAVVRTTGAEAVPAWFERHGAPIRYAYVPESWPLSAYQTVYATEPGSAEMPSAGRAFSAEVITDCIARGIDVAPLVLHCGVSSLEEGELPYAEQYRVPADTARRVEQARRSGGRVVAVGTTVVRALETVTDEAAVTHPGAGWTELVLTPERGVRAVDGLLTGWHEPRASHLLLLEAVAGRPLLEASYEAALAGRFRWHEFGDLHLILP